MRSYFMKKVNILYLRIGIPFFWVCIDSGGGEQSQKVSKKGCTRSRAVSWPIHFNGTIARVLDFNEDG